MGFIQKCVYQSIQMSPKFTFQAVDLIKHIRQQSSDRIKLIATNASVATPGCHYMHACVLTLWLTDRA